MNRIEETFRELRGRDEKALIAYVTAGDPSIEATYRFYSALEQGGADIIELGIPFSDPIADGPTIQKGSERSLKAKTTPKKVFDLVKKIRKKSKTPIVLLTYYNIVFRRGVKKFVSEASEAGADGIIIPDLPLEEANDLVEECWRKDFSPVFLVAPTTPEKRIKKIVEKTRGFVYLVSLTGVTGERNKLPEGVPRLVKKVKSLTKKPVAVGFGISTPQQVKQLSAIGADASITGSAFVSLIEKNLKSTKKASEEIRKLAASLKKALKA